MFKRQAASASSFQDVAETSSLGSQYSCHLLLCQSTLQRTPHCTCHRQRLSTDTQYTCTYTLLHPTILSAIFLTYLGWPVVPGKSPRTPKWIAEALVSGLWSRSHRLGLETYQCLVLVSSREKLSTSRSREADVSVSSIYVSCPRPIFGQIVQATVCSVNGL